MKKLIAFLTIVSQTAFAALPPTSVQGQSEAFSRAKFNLQTPFNQVTDLGGIKYLIETGNSNILPNPGFEATSGGWTASGGATAAANATALGTGAKGYDWDSNAAAQTLVSSSIAIPNGLKGKNGVARCSIKTVSGTSTHTMTVDDGTNDIVSAQTINQSTSSFIDTVINFVFPSSGNIRLKLKSVASNEPELYIDNCYIGLADNVSSVAQAVLLGTVKITGCAAQWSTTSTTYASYGTQTGCSYATTGQALAPSTNIPAIRFNTLPPGNYKLEYEGLIEQSTANGASFFQFYDGTNTALEESVLSSSASFSDIPSINQSISYTSPQSNVTLQIRGKVSSATNRISGTTTYPGVIRVYYFPSSAQQAVTPVQQRAPTVQKLLANTSYTFTVSAFTASVGDTYTTNGQTFTVTTAVSGGTSLVTSYSGTVGPLSTGTLTRATGSGTASGSYTAVTGSGTYTPTNGAVFIKVKMIGGGGGGAGSGSASQGSGVAGNQSTFGSVLTANGGSGSSASGASAGAGGAGGTTSSTITSFGQTGNAGQSTQYTTPNGGSGGAGVFGGAGIGASASSAQAGTAAAVNSGAGGGGASYSANNGIGGGGGGAGGYIEAVISPPSSSYSYTVGTGGTGGVAGTSGGAGGAGGSGVIIVEEYYSQTAPILVGSVTSNSSGAERIERARVTSACTTSPCTIADQSGSWLTNITRSAVGTYSANYPSGTFSSAPTCFVHNLTINRIVYSSGAASTTAFPFQTGTAAGANEDDAFNIICMGAR